MFEASLSYYLPGILLSLLDVVLTCWMLYFLKHIIPQDYGERDRAFCVNFENMSTWLE